MPSANPRRREKLAARAKTELAPASIRVEWAEPPRMRIGECPRCGKKFGRALRAHTEKCAAEALHDKMATQ